MNAARPPLDVGEAWHRHRHEQHGYGAQANEGCYPLTCLGDILARLQAGSPAQEPTICRCGLARSYHGPPTNLADHEYEPATATGTERLREGYPVNVDLEDNPTLVGWVLDHD